MEGAGTWEGLPHGTLLDTSTQNGCVFGAKVDGSRYNGSVGNNDAAWPNLDPSLNVCTLAADGDRLLVALPHDATATQSVPLSSVLDSFPTPEQWTHVEAEACGRALRGEAPPLTLQQVRAAASYYTCNVTAGNRPRGRRALVAFLHTNNTTQRQGTRTHAITMSALYRAPNRAPSRPSGLVP